MTLMEKNARKIINISIIQHIDIRRAMILAGFVINTSYPRLTDRECHNIAINYPYSYETIRAWFNYPLTNKYITEKKIKPL